MPLEKSQSEAAFSHNVAEMIAAGHPRANALAAAYSIKRGKDSDSSTESFREYDVNSWPEIKNNPLSRVGVFPYLGKQISKKLDPNKIYMVYRPEEELSNPECIESFKLLPWIDLHPKKLLGPESAGRMPAEQKGVEGVIGEDVYFEGDTLYGNLKCFSESLQDNIDSGEKKELSIGYACKYDLTPGTWNGKYYDAIQRNLRGNHVASVPKGRMGPEISVLDSMVFTFDAKDIKMPEAAKLEHVLTLDEVNSWLEKAEPKDLKKTYDMLSERLGAKDKAAKDAAEKEASKAAKDAEEKLANDKAAKDAAEKAEAEKKKAEADKAAKDAEEKLANDKAAKDAEEKEAKEKEKTMAADAAISSLQTELASLKSNATKTILNEISKRDEIVKKLSPHIGTFDAADKTLDEVRAYAVEKLGLKCPKGQEQTAIDSYLTNRSDPTSEIGFSFDSASVSTSSNPAKDFYNKAA